MSVFNSSANLNQEDADMTIINHSFLFDRNDEPISSCIPVLRRSQQTNRSKPLNNQTNSDSTQDYIYVDHNLLETANHIERILKFYRQDLKQESNTQLDCNQQLITRLIDFIRPAYSSNREKLNDLDILFQEISTLHDVKFIEQKEKTEQLQTEIAHLKKLIITTADEDDSGNNTTTQIYRINSMINFEQWKEIEEETKKLHNLVEAQRDQIDKLIGILSLTDITINPSSRKSVVTRTCYLCDYEFPQTFNDDQRIAHIEKCSGGVDNLNISLDLKQWECPYCAQKFITDDETGYIQHLSQCYSDDTGNS